MSDNSSSNNSKVTPSVFYAQKSKDSRPKRDNDKRDFSKSGAKKAPNSNRNSSDSRIETFKPKSKPFNKDKPFDREKSFSNKESTDSSPWKKRFSDVEQAPTFKAESKSGVDTDLIKKQRKEEVIVYSENSCKAVFEKRPNAIVKAFFTEEKTYQFKALIAWLVEQRLGYDVISDEQMAKIAQTPHHGGVCLIIKKRQGLNAGEYLLNNTAKQSDCILAIDDINNPHNLGGIARTAAFFNVNGLILRQPELLENGAALRVSEGGSESLTLIKADDFIATIDQFKTQGYEVVALLPCKVSSIKAQTLDKYHASNGKVVYVIFQQINIKLAKLADKVVYLPGSEAMAALNISVLAGILLAKQNNI